MKTFTIEDICYAENDAFLVVDGVKYYFQFKKKPNLKSALQYLFLEGLIDIG